MTSRMRARGREKNSIFPALQNLLKALKIGGDTHDSDMGDCDLFPISCRQSFNQAENNID